MSKEFSTSLKLGCTIVALAFAAAPASATTLTTIKSFCGTGTTCTGSGGTAFGQGVVNDGNDNFFGVNASGGVYGHGQAFKLKKNVGSYSYVPIYDFCPSAGCADGSGPVGNLIIDTNGNLYGVTAFGGGCTPNANGCGTIFMLSPTAGTTYNLTTLYTFCSSGSTCPNGAEPAGALTYVGDPSSQYDGTSTLFGTTSIGGANAKGSVFKLTGVSTTPTESVIYSFCPSAGCADGQEPNNLIADGSGNLFGATPVGGQDGDGDGTTNGVVFELSPSGGSYTQTVLWSFCATMGCTDGITPDGQLAITSNGKLVGETAFGGSYGDGTVFRITPNGTSSTESIRHSFCAGGGACSDGMFPRGGITIDSNGDYIGVTGFGGNRQAPGGTVFKLSGNNPLATLYSFCPAGSPCTADGNLPQSHVALDASGNVYGTTTYGGANGGGTAFQLVP